MLRTYWTLGLLASVLTGCGGGGSAAPVAASPQPAAVFSVGGNVSGLQGSGLILRNNAADDLPVHADGRFTFSAALNAGGAYSVSIVGQPLAPAQNCAVDNASGSIVDANVTDVVVTCLTPPPLQSVVFEREGVDQSDLYLVKEDGSGAILLAGTVDNEEFEGIGD